MYRYRFIFICPKPLFRQNVRDAYQVSVQNVSASRVSVSELCI